MRILIAAPRIPFPPNDGGKIVMFDAIRFLGELGHEVHVVAFAGSHEADAVRGLAGICASTTAVAPERLALAKGFVADPPVTLARYHTARMQSALLRIAEMRAVDVVAFETLHMAVYGKELARYPRILRTQNAEHVVWARHASTEQNPAGRMWLRWQARRVSRYEAQAITDFVDSTLAVSPADLAALARIAPRARIDYLPMGVDSDYFAPRSEPLPDPQLIVLTGSFEWAPKRHNLAVLANELFPQIRRLAPNARLWVVGRGLRGAARDPRRQDGVEYVGEVADVRPYIARAAVIVNYVESGGGIAIKVLEALAMEKPVVANTIAAEGIDASNGRHLIIASTKDQFVERVAALLRDPVLQARLGRAGRELILEKYSSRVLAQRLARYLDMIASLPRRPQSIDPRGVD